MAFGFLKKIGAVLRVANQVSSNPLVGAALGVVPFANTAFAVIKAADTLFPQDDSGEQKKKQAMIALQKYHPEFNDETLSSMIDAMVIIKKMKASE